MDFSDDDDEEILKPNQKSIKQYLGGLTVHAPSGKRQKIDHDDVLEEMLLDVPETIQKPKTTTVTYKRPRLSSSSEEDEFDDDDDIPIPGNNFNLINEKTEHDSAFNINNSINVEDNGYKQNGAQEIEYLYWYECSEDQVKQPGTVFFFGKTKTSKGYASCCTIVKNVQKTIYLLIKEDCTYDQVLAEFTHITAKKFKIKNFVSEKATKKYAFSNVPLVGEYVKIDYPAAQATLPRDLSGETFSHVLNVSQSPMEKMILDLKLRGPCWLKLTNSVVNNSPVTWSRVELVLESPKSMIVLEDPTAMDAPHLCTFSLSLRTYTNPVTHHNEIIAITGMVNLEFYLDRCLKKTNKADRHFCIVAKPSTGHKELKLPFDFQSKMKKYRKTKLELVESERDLLVAFMEKFSIIDPDIVVGHDLLNFDFETLVNRMRFTKVGVWSKLGRFKRSELPSSTKSAFKYLFSGRIMCDIRTSAMELIHSRSYDLKELTSQVLKKARIEFDHAGIVESFKSSDKLFELLDATWEDNDNIFSILVELNVIPLALKITNITGNILSRTLTAGRSERNEYLLLHAFHEENFICPEKHVVAFNPSKQAPVRKKAAYLGGLVLEPKAGYYDTCILLMDFNSLYPSIIQEFNICFSTVKMPDLEIGAEAIESTVPDESVERGVLPAQLKRLVDRRRQVKRLLETKSNAEKLSLDIEQKALKLTANSMYGCLGFEHSRFYAKHLASLVTFKGREILMSTKAMVEKLGYEVIYGDTDSLMIDTKITDYDEVMNRGMSIKEEINRSFKLLEIDVDGVYKPLLLLKKKNYAGSSLKKLNNNEIVKVTETKGLDTVRRDRAVIAKEAGERVLSMVLDGEKDIIEKVEDIHNYLKELGDKVRDGEVPNEKFLISKQLNRNPDQYQNTKGIGHVALALRYNQDSKKTRKLKAGDTVEYVICSDNTSESANQRAYTLEELKENSELKLDHEYYLCQQIHPVMTRICDKLPVTNAYVLAEMLGIEKSSMLHIRRDETSDTRRDQLTSRGEARFHSCQPLVVHCFGCGLADEITCRVRKNKLSLAECANCGIQYSSKAKFIVVQIISLIKRLTLDLYNTVLECENADCEYKTRNVFGPCSPSGQLLCETCKSPMIPNMDDKKMDLQLQFIKYLFDTRTMQKDTKHEAPSDALLDMYKSCFKEVDYALRCSFSNNIDTYSIFRMICSQG